MLCRTVLGEAVCSDEGSVRSVLQGRNMPFSTIVSGGGARLQSRVTRPEVGHAALASPAGSGAQEHAESRTGSDVTRDRKWGNLREI